MFVIVGTPPDLQAFRRRRAAEERQRSPSPSSTSNHHAVKKGSAGPLSPRDRFKDAKEKFLLLEEQEKQMQRRRNMQTAAETPISPAVLPTAANSRGELLLSHAKLILHCLLQRLSRSFSAIYANLIQTTSNSK
jgi:hypothetical protein